MTTYLYEAVTEYLAALDATRTLYIQTARNAPREAEVRHRKAGRLSTAEDRLRTAVEETFDDLD